VAKVSWLSVAPVKGLALTRRDELALESFGALENRRFHLLDERGRFVNGLTRVEHSLFAVSARWEPDADTLALTFPDGSVVDGRVDLGEHVSTWFYDRDEPGRIVRGLWAQALSDYAGRELRLARTDAPGRAVDRTDGSVSIVSDESVDELARQAGVDSADARRFRMLVGVGGGEPHQEDTWIGRDVRIGEALVRVHEQVARCAITTKNPDTGERDLDALRVIKAYRGTRGEKQLDFGVYGEVVTPGRVRVGDAVEPLATV
jgi:uncharacterized protein YcbX